MLTYSTLSSELQEKIKADRVLGKTNPYRCSDKQVLRRNNERDKQNLWRTSFVRDTEKIMHSPYYNRYADKTQVFSFYRNDDITRRALHVQLVSRIARNIGSILGLELDLIEAISLGHDIGHTPFGHAGEKFLSELLQSETGRHFNHNVHSVRVLDNLSARNISLQTLDGILCHNGEFEQQEYRPCSLTDFRVFDQKVENCYVDKNNVNTLIPSTLEACVVRVCDMISYLGKDRQDAKKAQLINNKQVFTEGVIGTENAQIINNLTVNIIENSYGKDYIMLDKDHFHGLKTAKDENYALIYNDESINKSYNENIKPMFYKIYYKLLKDVKDKKKNSVIYKHHIKFVNNIRKHYVEESSYTDEEPNQIVVDYIASMTDDYFIDLYSYLFPEDKYKIKYVSYFDDMK